MQLSNQLGVVTLKKGKESIIKSRHPWIFSGAIANVENVSVNGQLVIVKSYQKENLAIGSYSQNSQISVRIWSFDTDLFIDKNFFVERFNNALQLRKSIFQSEDTNAYRIINSESDLLPGLIVDYYAGYYVVQFLTAGAEFFRDIIIQIIKDQNDCLGIYERSDTESREKEKLQQFNRILDGNFQPDKILFKENGLSFYVDLSNGHKTGFYLDQRDNRLLVQKFSYGKNVLNCFSYTGGFSIYAINGGASFVTNIDSAESALKMSDENHSINNIPKNKFENIEGDVFKLLRKFRDENKKFDLIILDPPKFADSEVNIIKASRGYKDINLLSMKLLNNGGILFTFSCSGHISLELFRKIINSAAIDSGKNVKIIKQLTQSSDHPIVINFPESFYLKGFVCYVE